MAELNSRLCMGDDKRCEMFINITGDARVYSFLLFLTEVHVVA